MASCASSPRVLCCRYMADKTALAEEAKEGLGIRVLVALDDEHRAYREVIAAGIEVLRPSVKAATTRPPHTRPILTFRVSEILASSSGKSGRFIRNSSCSAMMPAWERTG
jgi:hypothetical protein